ncbi:MAG TPA: LysR substrate-binding domain-containing protein [Solirubrobacter sp.]|nr:LysR substrate-binding domain-containing protein [Solirubrobacter sp.]
MELRHLRYFIAVAEELHFRRAAERLHMSQPPLSQQIRQLEEEVGAQLLVRNQRRVELTAAGSVFLVRARDILASVEDAARQARRVQRGEVGRLAVGFVGSAMYSFVPELLRAFRDRAPDIALRLHELGTTEQLRQLEDGRLDVGFLRTPGRRPGLQFETVLEEQIVVALPDTHALAQRPLVSLRDLAGESLVLLTHGGSPGLRAALAGALAELGGEELVTQEVAEMQTVIGLVAAGVGLSLVPESVRALERHGVTYRPLTGGPPAVRLAMAWRAADDSPVLRRFLTQARAAAPTEGERGR